MLGLLLSSPVFPQGQCSCHVNHLSGSNNVRSLKHDSCLPSMSFLKIKFKSMCE